MKNLLKATLLFIFLLYVDVLLGQYYEPITVNVPELFSQNGELEISGFKLDNIKSKGKTLETFEYNENCKLISRCPRDLSCRNYAYDNNNLTRIFYDGSSKDGSTIVDKYGYDEKDRIISRINGDWNWNLRFDSLDRITYKSDSYSYSGNFGYAESSSSSSFSYDSLGNWILEEFEASEFDNLWGISSSFGTRENEYNGVELVKSTTRAKYFDHVFGNLEDTTCVLNRSNYDKDEIIESIEIRDSIPYVRSTFSYTDSSYTRINYWYSKVDSQWVKRTSYEEIFDIFGNLISLLVYRSEKASERITYAYDEHNRLTGTVKYEYDDEIEIPYKRYHIEYDDEDRVILKLTERYKNNKWEESNFESFTYNDDGLLTRKRIDDDTFIYNYSTCDSDTTISNINNQEIADNSINIYPNPSHETFTVDASQLNSDYKITIFDISGQQLIQTEISAKSSISIGENLKKGIYLISMANGRQRLPNRLIVKL